MGNSYNIRQSSFTNGDVIEAGLFNSEFDQLVLVFNELTGHTHDGTAGEGAPVPFIADVGSLSKVEIDVTDGSNHRAVFTLDGVEVMTLDETDGLTLNAATLNVGVEQLNDIPAAVGDGYFQWNAGGTAVTFVTSIPAADVSGLHSIATSGNLMESTDIGIPVDNAYMKMNGSSTGVSYATTIPHTDLTGLDSVNIQHNAQVLDTYLEALDATVSGLTAGTTLDGKSVSSSGDRFDVIPEVDSSGSTDLGSRINFHADDGSADVADFSLEVTAATNGDLVFSNDAEVEVFRISNGGVITALTITGETTGDHTGTVDGKSLSANGDRFDVIPLVDAAGGLDIGSALDFHSTDDSSDGSDFRITVTGGTNGDCLFLNDSGAEVLRISNAGIITSLSNLVTIAPTSDLHAATKKYVDDQIISGGAYVHPGFVTTNINTSGAVIVDAITTTSEGHISAMSTRTLTLADLGYTGATDANNITNNNQIANGEGYTTNEGDITSVEVVAGDGITGGGIDTFGTTSFTITLDTPDSITGSSINEVTAGGHTHALTLSAADIGAAASSHTHTGSTISGLDAGDTSTGVFDIARLPTGTGGTDVALGNHQHTSYDYSTTISGATVFDEIDVTNGIVTNISTRTLTPGNIGAATSGHQHTSYDHSAHLSGANVFDQVNITNGIVTSVATRALTLANLGYTGATNANYITNNNQLTNGAGYTTNTGTSNLALGSSSSTAYRGDRGTTAYNHSQATHAPSNANYYVHPSYTARNASFDTGALSGASVISDINFDLVTDTTGHVTTGAASFSTRNLTLANLGYTGDTNAEVNKNVTISTSAPSGGSDGDVWYRY